MKKSITNSQRAGRLTQWGMYVLRVYGIKAGCCLCRQGKACKSAGKHPVDMKWPQVASAERAKVVRWFAESPETNIGIATGVASNLIVLDIDPRHDGQGTLMRAEEQLGPLPPTVTVKTGGGGYHLYFRYPDVAIKSDHAGKLVGSGVDVLSNGAFVVAPGSQHVSGGTYGWVKNKTLYKHPIATLPEAWVQQLTGNQASGDTNGVVQPLVGSSALIPEGKRNTSLCSLAGLLHGSGLSASATLSLVSSTNTARCRPPLSSGEVANIVQSVLRYPTSNTNTTGGDPAEQLMQKVVARHFAEGERLLFGNDGHFWHYDGRRWIAAPRKWLEGIILETIQYFRGRQTQATAPLIKQVLSLMEAQFARKDDVLRLCQEPARAINCRNTELWIGEDGSVDRRRHSAQSYLRHAVEVDHEPNAKCPMYDSALREIFQTAEDPDALIRHWHELVGYLIQPSRDIPTVVVLYGSGGNGKTALMRVVAELIGKDLVSFSSVEDLARSRFAIGSLLNKLVLIDDDVKAGIRLPDGELKKISEAKEMTGEHKFGSAFNFTCLTVPFLLCNNVISLVDISPGMMRRLMVIPFTHTFSGDAIDRNLFKRILETEKSGVLNRALLGLRRLFRRGKYWKLPSDVTKATQEWLRQANPLPAFIDERCIRNPNGATLTIELYRAYLGWADECGITLKQQRPAFSRNMAHLGFKDKRSNRGQKIVGVELKLN